jgi:hypothetical protein
MPENPYKSPQAEGKPPDSKRRWGPPLAAILFGLALFALGIYLGRFIR